jgi:hypothetical protein
MSLCDKAYFLSFLYVWCETLSSRKEKTTILLGNKLMGEILWMRGKGSKGKLRKTTAY